MKLLPFNKNSVSFNAKLLKSIHLIYSSLIASVVMAINLFVSNDLLAPYFTINATLIMAYPVIRLYLISEKPHYQDANDNTDAVISFVVIAAALSFVVATIQMAFAEFSSLAAFSAYLHTITTALLFVTAVYICKVSVSLNKA